VIFKWIGDNEIVSFFFKTLLLDTELSVSVLTLSGLASEPFRKHQRRRLSSLDIKP